LIVIELSVASVTVNEATPTCPENAAITVTVPGATPAAWPNDPDASLMIATDGFDDVHKTEPVIFCVVPSVSVPVATKPTDVFSATLSLAGVVIVIAVNASTVRLAVPLTPLSEQVIVTGPPSDTPVTVFPLTEATLVFEDVQLATVSRPCFVPSLKVPTTCNASVELCVGVLGASPALAAVTAIDESVAELTFSGADPVTPPKAAEIVGEPTATAVATPTLPDALLMVANVVLLLFHMTSCVMFCVLASLKVPMAVKDCAVSGAIVTLEGPTTIEEMVAVVTTSVAIPLKEPTVAVMVVIPLPTACARPGPVAIVATAVFDEAHVT
jgi:hypothetical protein